MIQINECKITKDGKSLVIDVAIPDKPYYSDTYIKGIYIDTQDTFVEGSPSNTAINVYLSSDVSSKHVIVDVSNTAIPLKDNLFFIYVQIGGMVGINAPCGSDREYTPIIVFYDYPIYSKGISYAKELCSNCCTPKNFIDFILNINAYKYALKVEDYNKAISYWRAFTNTDTNSLTIPKCNCNG